MRLFRNKKILIIAVAILLAITAFTITTSHKEIDYSTQVKPIFNKKCISCHGGVRQQSNFSLLFREEALKKCKSGKYAIIPGDPDHSEMIRRINLKDPEDRMPYHHDPLSKEEINILHDWIKQGAKWGTHWAYVPVQKVEVPKPKPSFLGLIPAKKIDWTNNDIDYFIYDKLKQNKLQPSPEADKPTLLRRVSLDLIGMPAPDSIAQKYLEDNSDKAYEHLVDALLASKHYGEKWTAMWLDLARYADTKGYERDDSRSIWKYRDWLIDAFNKDQPYNEFLTEQLAGDLLPNATDDDYIATAFHRNTMTNDEGGTDNEEFRTAAVLDRVNTTWQALMGTTFACVQCHSHPYDPFKHDEYYKFMAFFNNSRDEDTEADYPLLREYKTDDSLRLIQLVSWLKENTSVDEAKRVYTFLKTWQPAINSLTADSFVNSELNDTKWLIFRNHAIARLKHVGLTGKTELIYRYSGFLNGGIWTIHLDKPDGEILKTIPVNKTTRFWTITSVDIPPTNGYHDLYFTYTNPNLKKPDDNGALFDWFYFTHPLEGKDKPGFAEIEKTFWSLMRNDSVATTPVMMDNPTDMHRVSNVFEKGNWLVKGAVVQADVPHMLNAFPKNAPHNRLGLAMWLTSKQNPLTSRTIVNRLWEQLFGTGIAETLEDLGTQGIEPTHRELLDYLSWQLMNDYNWSLKSLIKEMVMSATYRQSAVVSNDALEKDPNNKLYARAPRIRLTAEEVRDQALCISGLISNKMYGPGVMPWQPPGIWQSPWNSKEWVKSDGEDQYRRAVYTYWKRTASYPSMVMFDGADREVCTARRIRTNTPLQALVTLNDSVYVEAARHFAFRMQQQTPGNNVPLLISKGYEDMMYKPIEKTKLSALENLYNTAYTQFKNDAAKTCEMVGGMNTENTSPETAALVVVANAMLNLDEVVTKN
ncbi:MAG TPA: DUF1553 domain-containing protein [Parafilimonas sp.]|nr:DUF1553 domain-containing protein [Parafilimonas sp.]